MEEVLPISKGAALTSPEELAPRSHGVSAIASAARLPPPYAVAATLLIVGGSAALLPLWISAAHVWAIDPLRSIGAVFPAIALLGVLARWRDLGWTSRGTFWGLPILLAAIPLARVVSLSTLQVTLADSGWELLHLGPALFLYGVGATLLFGGPRLLRAALAPLCLLLAINPVPHAFNAHADLPLQQLSAITARAFAHLIGLQPTGEQLRMMFAPNFGMLIVPGCNGVRGSVTLAYLTLIFGYTRRLGPVRLAAAAVAALMAGYALNLLRLCVLVLYYRIGIAFPSIQPYGEGVDYAIGCTLFLIATVAIGVGVRALEPPPKPSTAAAPDSGPDTRWNRPGFARALCFLAFTLLFIVPELRSLTSIPTLRPNERQVLSLFPAQVGPFRLAATRVEYEGNGILALALGDYIGSAGRPIAFGLWVASPDHMVAGSRMVQGQRAERTGSIDTDSRSGLPVHLVSSEYNTGVSRIFDAEAACSPEGCSSQIAGDRNRGYLFIGPRFSDLVLPHDSIRLPILFERETLADDPAGITRERLQFEQDVRLFTQQIDLPPLLQYLGSRP